MGVKADRLKRVVSAWVSTFTNADAFVWAPSNYPRRSLGDSVITARLVRGPTDRAPSIGYVVEPTRLRWSVSGAVEDDRVGLALTGIRWAYDVQNGDTDTDVRDAVLALVQADSRLLPDVTITTDGADGIDFDASGTLGRLWSRRAIGSAASWTVTTSEHAEVQTAISLSTIELQAYVAGQGMEAAELLTELLGSLNLSEAVQIRSDFGVSLLDAPGDVVDLTTIAGADWESRASARLLLAARSYKAVPTEIVESATVEMTTS